MDRSVASDTSMSSIRIRIRPHEPLPCRPMILSCATGASFDTLWHKISHALFKHHQRTAMDALRLEIDGFTVAEDGVVGDIVRESDVVEYVV